MEERELQRRLRLQPTDVPRFRRHVGSAIDHGLRPLVAKSIAGRLSGCASKHIAFAVGVHPTTVRKAVREGVAALRARDLFDCQRLLDASSDAEGLHDSEARV